MLLTENYLLRVEYGLWPFRAATRLVHEEPSVLSRGVEAYLAQVSEVRQRFPEMLILPGVEVIPHYHWTGSPFSGDLTHHDLQKNLLVFGITDPADLKRLPSTGNPAIRTSRAAPSAPSWRPSPGCSCSWGSDSSSSSGGASCGSEGSRSWSDGAAGSRARRWSASAFSRCSGRSPSPRTR